MFKVGVPTYLIKILDNHVKNRTIQIQYNQKKSEKREITAVLPQGSILSSLIFNIFTSDIPCDQQTKLALYSDDCAVIAESNNLKAVTAYTKRHLENIFEYYKKWKLKANAEKPQAINFTWRENCNNHMLK